MEFKNPTARPRNTISRRKERPLQGSIGEHRVIGRRKRAFEIERQAAPRPGAGEQHPAAPLGRTENGRGQLGRTRHRDDIRQKVFKLLDECTPKAFIPCVAQGGPGSIYDGVYDTIMEAIDDYNVEHFGIKKEEIVRSPLQYEKIGYM